jgi:hypothetical protein
LPRARSREARPDSTQPTTSGVMTSRNDRESADWSRSASGQPPSSCTRTSAETASTSAGGASCSRSQAAIMSAQRSWCQWT